MNNTQIGKIGEEISVRYLIRNGWLILERNTKMRNLELDILGEKLGERVLFEIKTVAREMIGQDDISREIFFGSERFGINKHENMKILGQGKGVDRVCLLCVALSLQDRKAFIREMSAL